MFRFSENFQIFGKFSDLQKNSDFHNAQFSDLHNAKRQKYKEKDKKSTSSQSMFPNCNADLGDVGDLLGDGGNLHNRHHHNHHHHNHDNHHNHINLKSSCSRLTRERLLSNSRVVKVKQSSSGESKGISENLKCRQFFPNL